MSYKEEFAANNEELSGHNTDLDSLIELANALPDKKCTVTVNVVAGSSSDSVCAFVYINDTSYEAEDGAEATVIEVDKGTEIYLNVTGNASQDGQIVVNGETVVSIGGTAIYPYTVTKDTVINLSVFQSEGGLPYGYIEVTTSATAAPVIEPLEITENGTYTAPDGVDGYSPITVNVEASGGDADTLDALISNTLTTLESNATSIRQYMFRGATKIKTMSFPAAKSVATNAIYGCTALTTVDLPAATSISDNVFNGCSKLVTVNLPKVTSIGSYAFRYCYALTTLDLPLLPTIVANAFGDCRVLTAVILRKTDAICTLAATSAFSNCYHFHGTVNSTYNPDGLQDGYIYVPSALLAEYQAATNWSTFSTQFRALEDYTVDGTTTGELDETKI